MKIQVVVWITTECLKGMLGGESMTMQPPLSTNAQLPFCLVTHF